MSRHGAKGLISGERDTLSIKEGCSGGEEASQGLAVGLGVAGCLLVTLGLPRFGRMLDSGKEPIDQQGPWGAAWWPPQPPLQF